MFYCCLRWRHVSRKSLHQLGSCPSKRDVDDSSCRKKGRWPHHSSDVNLVDSKVRVLQDGDESQNHPSAEVEERCQAMISKVLDEDTSQLIMTSFIRQVL